MDIKFIKKNLSIIIIMTIIITGIMVPRSKATDALEPGKTLLNYTDVDVKTEPGKELRIIMPNYENTVIDKVKIAGKEQALIKDQKAKKLFIMYTGEAGKVTLEFYKEKAKEPFVIRQMEIKKEKDGIYSAVLDPQITYSSETEKDRAFKIRDENGIKEIVICKRNAKGSYDYKEENIIFRNAESNEKANSNYTDTKLTDLGKKAIINIKKLDEYGYYEIKVTSMSGLIHKREVKISGKMSSPETKAKNENGFAPSIKADKTNPDKITFSIDKSDKVTSAKMYPIINGKISKSAITLDNIKKSSGYVTSFTFAKEGMFRLVLLNKAGEKVASSTDFIISRKNNSDEWRINESPRVTRSSKKDDIQNVKISDGAIKTIKIFIKKNGKYNLKEPIYIYENGKVTLTTPNYIDEAKSNYKDTKKIYIALRRVSANHRYLIQVTDKGGNDPELIRNKLFFVEKGKAKTLKADGKEDKDQNTTNTNTNGTAIENTVDQNTVNSANTNETVPDNTVDPNAANNANTNEMVSDNTVDLNAVNNSNTNGAATENTVDQNTVNSTNQNETKTEEMEKPKLTWNDDKKQLTVEIKEKSAKIKKVNLGNLKKYFTKVKKSSNDYKYVYNTTKLAEDKKNYTVKVTYENGKTEKSNKVTVKMEDQKPTIKFNKKTKELTVTDKDGIKSAKSVKLSEKWKGYFDKGQLKENNTKMVFKKTKNSSEEMRIKAKVTDKYDRTETTKKSAKVPKTKKTTSQSKGSTTSTTSSKGKTTTTSSSKNKTTSSSKKTTSSTKSSNSKPTISWNGHTKILTITAPSQIRKVEFNTQSIRNKFSVQHSSGSKWTYKLKDDTEINANVSCKVTYGSNTTKWTGSKYIKVVQSNYKTTYSKGAEHIIVSDGNGLKINNVKYTNMGKVKMGIGKRQNGKNSVMIIIKSKYTYLKSKYPNGYLKGRTAGEKAYNKSCIIITGKDNRGNSFNRVYYGSEIPW